MPLFTEYFNCILKIKIMLETYHTYDMLERIGIAGTEVFSNKVKELFNAIALKEYDPLSRRYSTINLCKSKTPLLISSHSRNKEFNADFPAFQEGVYVVEEKIKNFLKQTLEPITTVANRLLVLQRYEKLNLECLCLNRRYLDVALMLETEMENVKD